VKPILFVVGAMSSYRLQRLIADACVSRGRPIAYLYARGRDDTFERIRQTAEAQRVSAYAFEAEVTAGTPYRPLARRSPQRETAMALDVLARSAADVGEAPFVERIRRRVRKRRAERVANRLQLHADMTPLLPYRAVLGPQVAAADRLLRSIAPSALVVSEDGLSALLPIHAAARERRIPIVDMPYGNGQRRDLEISLEPKAERGELPRAEGPEGELVKRFAPQWIKRGEFDGAMMFPPAYVLAAESLGMTVRDAWIIHGGYADVLCVESEESLRVYRSEGIPESKLRLTGSPYCDAMFAAMQRDAAAKAAFRQPRRIDPARTRILVSWPPSYHADRGRFSEFPTYTDMSVTLLRWLAERPNCDVTISLHPAIPDADRQAMRDAGLQLTDDYVIDLIPRHDVFVTYFSSTVRWAIAAGKPVVNFDAYRIGLKMYDGAPGVLTVPTFASFQDAVSGLIAPDGTFRRLAEAQIAVADTWGLVDGLSTERILREIDGVTR
jgi:hypothetical protein